MFPGTDTVRLRKSDLAKAERVQGGFLTLAHEKAHAARLAPGYLVGVACVVTTPLSYPRLTRYRVLNLNPQ